MYLKKTTGPASVRLPNGILMTRADLPDRETKRWVASRKAAIVRAVDAGLIDREEACEMYGLTGDELDSWAKAVRSHGEAALKATRLQKYRQL